MNMDWIYCLLMIVEAAALSGKNSSIRNWLNNEFYNSTFSKEEQENILVSSSEGFDEK